MKSLAEEFEIKEIDLIHTLRKNESLEYQNTHYFSVTKRSMKKAKLTLDNDGYVDQVPLGYWRRGEDQFWHIKEDSALLINLSKANGHYDGDGSFIFFKWPDSTIRFHNGRVPCSKKEFDRVRRSVIRRLAEFN